MNRRVNTPFAIQIHTDGKLLVTIYHELTVAPDQTMLLEMNEFTTTLIRNKCLSIETKDDSLTDYRTRC